MSNKIDICVVCAWRANCQKKFSISGRDIRCTDFVRDASLPDEEEGIEVEDRNKEDDSKTKSYPSTS